MDHSFANFNEELGGSLSYEIRVGDRSVSIEATTSGETKALRGETIEEFILEHYWGFTKQADGTTSEYRVEHEPWRYWETSTAAISGDIASLYPAQFKAALSKPAHSAFVAPGSAVSVFAYRRFHPLYSTTSFPKRAAEGYLLYDSECGLCSWWMTKVASRLTSAQIEIAPLRSEWVAETLATSPGLYGDDICLLLADGTLFSGADVYISLMKRVRGTRLLGQLLGLPIVRGLTWMVYRMINRNRFAISRACDLRPHHPHEQRSESLFERGGS